MGHSVDPDYLRDAFEGFALHLEAQFARVESRHRLRRFLNGLLAGLPRVNPLDTRRSHLAR
ncbi:hypothetical protein I6A60_08545 [Frankia sp. AgB1.9]|uniref:hypothetical protein n=1 Tax=unclassified Frankia TaxID=2632575 RepID=UPI001933A12E|nr:MULTISPECIES: hypothetical protein [unclassified Frankia]MBL7487175.1 hypothetical protein [Frankia sp. AgW1.1]MBL7547920.1 hypothetical protein [Frankia sp. AgB1.9]MBL7623955.1 hypothetical protein [Frankia sp. AgB1.8]